jgi:glycosyltransferase involved in cell wall biosynthesis
MKIAVDAKWMSAPLRGMGKYAHQMTACLKNSIIYFQPTNNQPLSSNAVCKKSGFFPIWEQWIIPSLCKQAKIDVLLCPYNTAPLFIRKQTKLVIVVHDLIFLKKRKTLPLSKSWYQNFGRFYRAFVVPRIIKKADVIVTVSNFTKQELMSQFSIDSDKLFVIPNSIDQAWLSLTPIPLNNRDDYFLTVAGDAPSKNVARLIRAFSVFKQNHSCSIKLKLVGLKAEIRTRYLLIAKEAGVDQDVVFLDFLSNEQLQNVYLHSMGFIFASTFEGFGIPLLEAMSCCVPVACSNTTSMPEVLDGHGVLFDPYSVESIAEGFAMLADINLWSDKKMSDARVNVLTRYSYNEVSKQFEAFWRGLK